jgi:hypothetical protein
MMRMTTTYNRYRDDVNAIYKTAVGDEPTDLQKIVTRGFAETFGPVYAAIDAALGHQHYPRAVPPPKTHKSHRLILPFTPYTNKPKYKANNKTNNVLINKASSKTVNHGRRRVRYRKSHKLLPFLKPVVY